MSKQKELFKLMKVGQWFTSLEIDKKVKTVAAGSMVGDLRKKGCLFVKKYVGNSEARAQIWAYKMTFFPKTMEINFKKGVS